MKAQIITLAFLTLFIDYGCAIKCWVGGRLWNTSEPSPIHENFSLQKTLKADHLIDIYGPKFYEGWKLFDCNTLTSQNLNESAMHFNAQGANTWVCEEARTCTKDQKVVHKICKPWVKGNKEDHVQPLNGCNKIAFEIRESCLCDKDGCNNQIEDHYQNCSHIGAFRGIKKVEGGGYAAPLFLVVLVCILLAFSIKRSAMAPGIQPRRLSNSDL